MQPGCSIGDCDEVSNVQETEQDADRYDKNDTSIHHRSYKNGYRNKIHEVRWQDQEYEPSKPFAAPSNYSFLRINRSDSFSKDTENSRLTHTIDDGKGFSWMSDQHNNQIPSNYLTPGNNHTLTNAQHPNISNSSQSLCSPEQLPTTLQRDEVIHRNLSPADSERHSYDCEKAKPRRMPIRESYAEQKKPSIKEQAINSPKTSEHQYFHPRIALPPDQIVESSGQIAIYNSGIAISEAEYKPNTNSKGRTSSQPVDLKQMHIDKRCCNPFKTEEMPNGASAWWNSTTLNHDEEAKPQQSALDLESKPKRPRLGAETHDGKDIPRDNLNCATNVSIYKHSLPYVASLYRTPPRQRKTSEGTRKSINRWSGSDSHAGQSTPLRSTAGDTFFPSGGWTAPKTSFLQSPLMSPSIVVSMSPHRGKAEFLQNSNDRIEQYFVPRQV